MPITESNVEIFALERIVVRHFVKSDKDIGILKGANLRAKEAVNLLPMLDHALHFS